MGLLRKTCNVESRQENLNSGLEPAVSPRDGFNVVVWLSSLNFPFCKTWANMSNRVKLSIALFVFGLSLAVAGVATDPHALLAGMFALAVAERYLKRSPFWDYLVLLILALVIVALVPLSSIMIVTISLTMPYVLEYIDYQPQKRAALSTAALAPETTPAELSAVPNGGPAAPVENMKLTEGPPSVNR